MKKFWLCCCVVLMVLVFAAFANADTTWQWTETGGTPDGGGVISAGGFFTTVGDATTAELITSISGTRNVDGIAGLVALGTDGGFLYDDLFVNSAPFFNNNGLLMDVSGQVGHVNIYSIGSQLYDYTYSNIPPGAGQGNGIPVTFTASAVPEPATLLLLGVGFLAVVCFGKRYSHPASAA